MVRLCPQTLIPSGGRSPDIAGTDLVMCFEPVIEQRQVTCDTGRTRNGMRVPGSTRNFPRVPLNTGTLAGGAPAGCTVNFGTPGASRFRGSASESSVVHTYLAPLLGDGSLSASVGSASVDGCCRPSSWGRSG